MLTGSMAMAIYSVPSMTRDIDLVVEIKPTEVEKIMRIFSEDCYIDQEAVRQAMQTYGIFNIIHNDRVIKADFQKAKENE